MIGFVAGAAVAMFILLLEHAVSGRGGDPYGAGAFDEYRRQFDLFVYRITWLIAAVGGAAVGAAAGAAKAVLDRLEAGASSGSKERIG